VSRSTIRAQIRSNVISKWDISASYQKACEHHLPFSSCAKLTAICANRNVRTVKKLYWIDYFPGRLDRGYDKKKRHRSKVAVHKRFRQNKRRNKSVTTNLDCFDLELIIRKMRLPILVLCLAVVYGTCRIYGENVDLIDREESELR